MKKSTRFLALALSLVFLAAVSGCGGAGGQSASSSPSPAPAAGSKGTIAVTIPTAQSIFCYNFALGVKAAAEEMGYECVIDDPNVDLEAQITAMENFVTSGVKGMVVFPVDGQGVSDAAAAAMDKGVVVTAYDAATACHIRVAEDEDLTGRLLAQPGIDWVKANCGGVAEIALLVPNEADDSHNGRILAGLKAAIEEQLPDSTIVSIQKSVDAAETMTLVENVTQAYPDVQLFYCQLDDVIAYEALNSLGYNRDDVCLVGASGLDEVLSLIDNGGVLRATIVSDIFNTGYQAAMATIQQVEGKTPDPVGVSYSAVTADNVKDYLPAA